MTHAGLERLVPGISIAPNNAYTNYNIRGITSGGVNALSDTAIAVNYNGVSLATPSSASGMYFDLERVELVNGPQGTLYGRNATAGAINVVAKRPVLNEFSTTVGADVGNYDIFNARAAVNIPLSENTAMRIAGQTVNHGGYYSDGNSNQHDKAARISFFTRATDNLSLYLTGDYASTDNNGLGVTFQQDLRSPFCFVADERTGLEDLMTYLPQARPASSTDSYFWGPHGNAGMGDGPRAPLDGDPGVPSPQRSHHGQQRELRCNSGIRRPDPEEHRGAFCVFAESPPQIPGWRVRPPSGSGWQGKQRNRSQPLLERKLLYGEDHELRALCAADLQPD